MAGLVLANLVRIGYGGDIHLVSRRVKEIGGRVCVSAIEELPLGIDVAVLVVPAAVVLDAVASCIERQIGGAVVFASGFAETDAEGRALQERLAALARAGGFAINGPNCLGFTNFIDRVALTFNAIETPVMAAEGRGVGIIAQSGALAGVIHAAMAAKGLPVNYAISTGNEAVIGAEDFLASLIADDETAIILLFMEQIRQPARFLDLIARARARGKSVLLMHPGSSERARESARSHTGALAGDYAVLRTVLGHAGVVLVDTLDELFDAASLLACWPDPPSAGAAVVTNSGAFRGVALDFCPSLGLDLPPLTPATLATLRPLLPPFVPVDNPLDLTTLGIAQPDIYGQTSGILLADENVGSLIVAMVAGGPRQQEAKGKSMLPVMAATRKPVAFAMMGDEAPLLDEFTQPFRNHRIPFFRSADRAMRAMAAITAYGRHLKRSKAAPSLGVRGLPPLGSGTVPEYRAKAYLAAAGIAVPEGELAGSAAMAREIAARIGYPVVMKLQSAALLHKSDIGGVVTGLGDPAAVADAWAILCERFARARPQATLDGILVERMATPGLEMIVGAKRDRDWGVVVMLGLGGIWTEALADVRLLPPDLAESEILAEISRLKGARLLSGMRGSPPLDVVSLARAVATIGALMRDASALLEIEINPLIVHAQGAGVAALDALIITEG